MHNISHALVDGFSYFHFLSSWARISRGDRILSPHIPRDMFSKFIQLWTAAGEDQKVYITCPFDFRRTLTGFPKNYFGCGLCFATAETTRNHLLNASIGDLALLIKKSISVVKDEYIKQSLSTIDSFRRQNDTGELERIHLRHPQTGMIVTNLTRLPIRDIDFGSGPPEDFLTYAEIEQGAAILPAANGVETIVANPLRI